MGIPKRFAIEYPRRALQLIDATEVYARDNEFFGSFGLLASAAVITMPYERMKPTHFLEPADATKPLSRALRSLKKSSFLDAPFWNGSTPGTWRMTRVVENIRNSHAWVDVHGQHPFSPNAENSIRDRDAEGVLRVIRNALAHGNVVYLDARGYEVPGHQLTYLAFFSRYEESSDQRQESETYRVVAVGEEDFLMFVRHWALWVAALSPELEDMAAQ